MAPSTASLPTDLPAAAEAPRRLETAVEPCYRSEAFAEDLDGTEAVPVHPRRARRAWAPAPLGVALASALMAALGSRSA
jgi:hypothetical protein